ncbi:MAG: protein kinase [Acidobacteria bacterium]|nr:protein kinase [Acidobacteriota bacterium]
MSFQVGDRVGDYEIIQVLGAGGMGEVYKVRNIISERIEAMKVLLPNLVGEPELADRFLREIKVQASLDHPHIAALHTAQRAGSQILMIMEFVEGVTVEQMLHSGTIPLDRGIRYVRDTLSALSYAHARGVVHRDLKPANMMVTPDGVVKLMDFGIAKMAADRRLTQTGRTVGSLYYMSPEQIQGVVDLDARSDLYSLGVTLYEIVTGRRPFQGDSDYSIMAAHLNSAPVPPIEVDPRLPQALNDVILMSISKDPAQRFQSADAMAAALDSVAASLGFAARPAAAPVVAAAAAVPPPPPRAPLAQPRSRRGLYIAVGSVATLAVLVLAATQGPRFFRASTASPAAAVTTTTPGPAATGGAPASDPAAAPSSPAMPIATQLPQSASPSHTGSAPPAQSTPTATGTKVRPSSVQTAQQVGATQAQGTPSPGAQPAYQQPAGGPRQPASSQAPAVQTQTSAPAQPAADQGKLRELREELILLGTRAVSIKGSLQTLQQSQARLGLNINPEISTSRQRMEFYLDEAEAAIRKGEAAGARKMIDSAEKEVERLERFFGR